MKKTILCFDVDGTLANAQGEVHPHDLALLREADPSYVFVPCTGRLLPSVRALFSRYGLFSGRPLPFPLVLQNGGALYAPGEQLQALSSFDADLKRFAAGAIAAYPQVTFWVFTADKVHTLNPSPYAYSLMQRFDLQDAGWVDVLEEKAVCKLMALSRQTAPLAAIAGAAPPGMEVSYSLPTVLELNPTGVNKGRGLMELLAALELTEYPVMAAGDGGNDLSLFAQAACSFAPSAAPAEVRAAAGHVLDLSERGLLEQMIEFIDRP